MARRLARVGRRLLLAAALLLLVLEIPGAVELLRRPDLGAQLRETTVMVVSPTGTLARAGIIAGDRLLSVDNQPVHAYPDIEAALHGHSVGSTIAIAYARDGQRREAAIELDSRPAEQRALDLLLTVSALCFVFLGFTTYLRRDDALGRSFYWTCLLLALPFLDLPGSSDPQTTRLLAGARDGAVAFMPAFLLRFLLIFPEGTSSDSPRFRRQRLLLLPSALLAPLHLATSLAAGAAWQPGVVAVLLLATTLLFAAYFVTGLVVFVRKIRRRSRWALWTKLRLASIGLVTGVLPLVIATVARQFAPTQPLWIDRAAVLMLPLVPASFSMALLRAQAIDLAYLLRQVLLALFVGVPLVLVGWSLIIGVGPLVPMDLRPILAGVLGLVLAAATLGLRTPFRPLVHWIDHVLYPEQSRVRSGALELGRSLTRFRQPEPLLDHFEMQITALVGASHARVYEHEEKVWRPRRGDPTSQDLEQRLEHDSALALELARAGDLLLIKSLPNSRLDGLSTAWIEHTGSVLVCPLQTGDSVLGLLALGPPRSRETYGEQHLFHIASLCRQAAVALENARLHAEELQHERVRTELALAREIQQRLLPQEDLRRGIVEISGRTKSCRDVGGDFYDHFELSNGQIVIVVADASGKGVPASLLVSGLRTSVRETVRPGLPLVDAVHHLNRQIFAMTDTAHFIALFLGLLDPRDAMLEFVVAGAEAPLLFRAACPEGPPTPLNRGGPILGVTLDAEYHAGLVKMAPGDHLLVYSDGVVDEENPAGEEFGKRRLAEAGTSCFAMTSREILDRILESVEEHGTAESVDDTTLLVVRNAGRIAEGTHPAIRSASSGG